MFDALPKDESFKPYKLRIDEIQTEGFNVEFKEFRLVDILPHQNQRFAIYSGSDSSPPCQENVLRIVMLNPVVMNRNMLNNLDLVLPIKPTRHLQKLYDRPVNFGNHFFEQLHILTKNPFTTGQQNYNKKQIFLTNNNITQKRLWKSND